ncbi:MAG: hypothetical protein BYD32DRAFT_459176 [Podila humilis]|nr:MAG: hypothetical protein BYD32DRAFT_459176 [Podila humilis]
MRAENMCDIAGPIVVQKVSLLIDSDELTGPTIKFGDGYVMPKEGPLPLWILTIKDPYQEECLVHRIPILEALLTAAPTSSIHLSVGHLPWGPTIRTIPPDDWAQELARFPGLCSYSFHDQEATLATFSLMYDLQQLTTLDISARAGTFADYFNAIGRMDYDGQIKRTECMDCRPESNNQVERELDGEKDWMSGVWVCRNLQTLEIRLTEKDREGEHHKSELKSRMMFEYLTLVCPLLQRVSIQRQIIHFNVEGGPIDMAAHSGWGWLQRSSGWEGWLLEARDMFQKTGRNLALKGLGIDSELKLPTFPVLKDCGQCFSSRQCHKRQGEDLRGAMAMVGLFAMLQMCSWNERCCFCRRQNRGQGAVMRACHR